MKSRLLSTVSHELRTPVGTIRGYAQLMLSYSKRVSAREQRTHLRTIDQEAGRLEEMIAALLDISRLEAGALQITCTPVRLPPFIEAVAKKMFRRVRSHRLVLELSRNLPIASIDRRRIAQVLENLLDNAIKYSPAETEIRVAATTDGDSVNVCVSDQGIGIQSENLNRIFEPFFRVDDDRQTAHVEGTGLGLAICKGLIEAHRGRIWAEQRSTGGSVFSFTLPIATVEELRNWPTEELSAQR
ncbi:MAG: hypothetical protein HY678_07385 [Chloroflexi bacterium]|nr:hypothetical protein [Chloroflexota bacterium]